MRIAVIGLGVMGATHIRAWQRIPEAELVAVVSSKPADQPVSIGGNLASSDQPLDLDNVRRLSSLQDALRDSSIDALDLCIPTHLHADAAIAALNAGKHVLVEKPMALIDEDCTRMAAAARQSERLLMVGHVLRFWGDYQPLIQAAHSDAMGGLRALELKRQCAAPTWGGWLTDPAQSGGGAFDLLIHDVDLCVHLLGMPQAVVATGDSNYLNATLSYEGLGDVSISGGWHVEPGYPFSMQYTARFDEGTMEFSSADQPVTLRRTNGEVEHLAGGAVDAFEAELAYFAECVRSGHAAERCRMDESARAVKLMRLLGQSQSEHGKMIQCNP